MPVTSKESPVSIRWGASGASQLANSVLNKRAASLQPTSSPHIRIPTLIFIRVTVTPIAEVRIARYCVPYLSSKTKSFKKVSKSYMKISTYFPDLFFYVHKWSTMNNNNLIRNVSSFICIYYYCCRSFNYVESQ